MPAASPQASARELRRIASSAPWNCFFLTPLIASIAHCSFRFVSKLAAIQVS
jgi:hypothetical protein